MSASGTYRGEEIEVSFSADVERSDYGVPGSPVWEEIVSSSIKVASLEILGLDVKIEQLPADLQAAILGLSDGIEWQ